MRKLCELAAISAMVVLVACDRTPESKVDTFAGTVDSAFRAAINEYTEPELIALLKEGETGYVEASEYARTRATDPEVKAFAAELIEENKALTAAIDSTAKALSLVPTLPANDEGVVKDRADGMTELRATAVGKEFDERYLEYQIKMHRKILDEVRDALGRNPRVEVRSLLERVRAGLEGNLTQAEGLEKKFGTV